MLKFPAYARQPARFVKRMCALYYRFSAELAYLDWQVKRLRTVGSVYSLQTRFYAHDIAHCGIQQTLSTPSTQ